MVEGILILIGAENAEVPCRVQGQIGTLAAVKAFEATGILKAGNRYPLLHVLAVVPLIEIGLVLRIDAGPDTQRGARESSCHTPHTSFVCDGCDYDGCALRYRRPTKRTCRRAAEIYQSRIAIAPPARLNKKTALLAAKPGARSKSGAPERPSVRAPRNRGRRRALWQRDIGACMKRELRRRRLRKSRNMARDIVVGIGTE